MKTAECPSAPSAGFWETRLCPLLERHAILMTVLLVAIASARVAATYSQLSLTCDEPGHFACGMEYLSLGAYKLETQHPPLARAAMALGPYLAGVRLGPLDHPPPRIPGTLSFLRDVEGRRVIAASGDPGRVVALMRAGILPFFWIACWVVYGWTKHGFGKATAVLAVGLFSMLPPILAQASLATTDMALTACLIAAFWTLLRWAESPGYLNALAMGLAAAAAALSKFTALGYFPVAVLLALAAYLAATRPSWQTVSSLARARALSFGFAVLAGALTLWAAYRFSFGAVPVWNVRLPAPEFFDGIRAAIEHQDAGHPAYLLGETSEKGWWYFFPVALAVKTPLAFLLFLLGGVFACSRQWTVHHGAVFAFCLGILLPAMAGNVNIGVRHILPVYAGFAVGAALGLARMAKLAGTPAKAGMTAGLLVLWMAVSGAAAHPDYLGYFNAFGGSEPERILVDSDLDWGQNMKQAAKVLRARGATHVATNIPASITLVHINGMPRCTEANPWRPEPGWNLIGMTEAKHTFLENHLRGFSVQDIVKAFEQKNPWWVGATPDYRIGGVMLYHLSERTSP